MTMKIRTFAIPIAFAGSILPRGAAFLFNPSTRSPTIFPASVAIIEDPTATRDVATLEVWAEECGVQRSEGLQLESQDGVEWEAKSNQDLPEGTTLLAVPESMIFSALRTRQDLFCQEAEELLGKLGATNQLAQFYVFLQVLVEYEKGDLSPWFPWLNSLPKWFDNGAAMTPYCYECLPPLTASLAMEKRKNYIYFKDVLKQVPFISEQVKKNGGLTKWAYNVVITRSFPADGDVRMVPMADMFNHGTETEVEIGYDEDGNCFVYTTQDVEEGSKLRMSYGDPTNPSELLATYGFLDESSPATFCKIMHIPPSTALTNLGMDYSRMLFYKDSGDASEEVWDVLLYAKVLDTDREAQRSFYEAHVNGDAETKQAIHQHYFVQTATELQKHVNTFLKDLERLTKTARTMDPTEHPRIPLILRHNEFVKTTFLTVKQRVDEMLVEAR